MYTAARSTERTSNRATPVRVMACAIRNSGARVPDGSVGQARVSCRGRVAFTLVELIVVVVIIGLLLGIGIPAIGSMTRDSALNAGIQTMNGVLTRAHIRSVADRNLVAVRLVPAVWDWDTKSQSVGSAERQHAVTYSYQLRTDRPGDIDKFEYNERFVRDAEGGSVQLPGGVWAAPVESLNLNNPISKPILTGRIGNAAGDGFYCDPSDGTTSPGGFLESDDFLVVFDPRCGVRGSSSRTKYPLLAYHPQLRREVDRDARGLFQRYNYTGLAFYNREGFVSIGLDNRPAPRQNYLRRESRPYFVHRFGGGLVMGSPIAQP